MAYSTRKILLCLFLTLLSAQKAAGMENAVKTVKNLVAYPLDLTEGSKTELRAAGKNISDSVEKLIDPKTWDHLSNIVFFKLFGCISAAAGFATLHQWLNSLNNNKKSAPKAEPEIVAAKKMDLLTPEPIDPEDLEPEELTQETRNKKGNAIGKILPPLIGSLFAITGLVFILKARSISTFFVNRWSREKITKTERD